MSETKTLNNTGFEWSKKNLESTLEGEQKLNSPQLTIPVYTKHYTHHDPSVKPRRRISEAFAHHRLCERLL